ncbi:MAG: ABC transporter permease, partial [Pseudobutyrivibrio sp.]|nr:ABC transporter permease [Pseudobutyrivibrio sp.]
MIGKIPTWLTYLLKLNPMYYITSGYRDCFIARVGFWNRPLLTAYFWIFTVIVYLVGTHVFKKLQPQFADVL